MLNKGHLLYLVIGIVLLMVLIFIARTLEAYNYAGKVIFESGLFFDKVCYKGSYEMIVCPYTSLPYETFWAILSVLLVISVWAFLKKK